VLDARGEQALGLDLDRLAVAVQALYTDVRGALDRFVDPRHRQAALVHLLMPGCVGDHRVDQADRGCTVFADIHYDQTLADIDLDRRESDAGGVVHGLEHVVDEPAQRVVDMLDRLRAAAQTGSG
jgi:hypothetical protein